MQRYRLKTSPVLAAICFALSTGAAGAVTLNLDTEDPPEGQADFQDPRPPFPPDIGFVENGDRAVAGPFGITFQNVVTPRYPDEPFPPVPPEFSPPGGGVDEDGIFFGRTGDLEIVSVDLIFDIPTLILEYDIDFVGDAVAFDAEVLGIRSWFELSGPNGTSGQNFFDEEGRFPFDMGSIERFLPGEVYTLTHNIVDYAFVDDDPFLAGFDFISQIDEFELAAVPLPLPAGLLLTGVLGLFVLRRKAKPDHKPVN